MAHTLFTLSRKNEVWVVNLLAAIFGDQKIKSLGEKGELNTGMVRDCVRPPSALRNNRKWQFKSNLWCNLQT